LSLLNALSPFPIPPKLRRLTPLAPPPPPLPPPKIEEEEPGEEGEREAGPAKQEKGEEKPKKQTNRAKSTPLAAKKTGAGAKPSAAQDPAAIHPPGTNGSATAAVAMIEEKTEATEKTMEEGESGAKEDDAFYVIDARPSSRRSKSRKRFFFFPPSVFRPPSTPLPSFLQFFCLTSVFLLVTLPPPFLLIISKRKYSALKEEDRDTVGLNIAIGIGIPLGAGIFPPSGDSLALSIGDTSEPKIKLMTKPGTVDVEDFSSQSLESESESSESEISGFFDYFGGREKESKWGKESEEFLYTPVENMFSGKDGKKRAKPRVLLRRYKIFLCFFPLLPPLKVTHRLFRNIKLIKEEINGSKITLDEVPSREEAYSEKEKEILSQVVYSNQLNLRLDPERRGLPLYEESKQDLFWRRRAIPQREGKRVKKRRIVSLEEDEKQ
jgi:hypothetical protein